MKVNTLMSHFWQKTGPCKLTKWYSGICDLFKAAELRVYHYGCNSVEIKGTSLASHFWQKMGPCKLAKWYSGICDSFKAVELRVYH